MKYQDVISEKCELMGYSDIKNLTWGNITEDYRLKFSQQKTQTKNGKQTGVTYLPMNPQAIALLGERKADDYKVFSVPTQQACDKALKNLATKLELKKTLHFHIARHTFATTVTLSNGVPIESVSKMLGHKNLKTTQHYAKILDLKVSDDMKVLREKFSGNNQLKINKSAG